jgi:hypothetical protein
MRLSPKRFLFVAPAMVAVLLATVNLPQTARATEDPVVEEYSRRREAIVSRKGCEAQFRFGVLLKSLAVGMTGGGFLGVVASAFGTAVAPGPLQGPAILLGGAVGALSGPFVVYGDFKKQAAARQVLEDEATLADIGDFMALRRGDDFAVLEFQTLFRKRFRGSDASIGSDGERRQTPDARPALRDFQDYLGGLNARRLPTRPYTAALDYVLRTTQ